MEHFFLCFSFYDNFIKIFKIRGEEATSFNCINGLRFLMTCWVIFSHEFNIRATMLQISLDPNNVEKIKKTKIWPVYTVAFLQ